MKAKKRTNHFESLSSISAAHFLWAAIRYAFEEHGIAVVAGDHYEPLAMAVAHLPGPAASTIIFARGLSAVNWLCRYGGY